MTWEQSQTECSWCGTQPVVEEINMDEGELPLGLCRDCSARHRERSSQVLWTDQQGCPVLKMFLRGSEPLVK